MEIYLSVIGAMITLNTIINIIRLVIQINQTSRPTEPEIQKELNQDFNDTIKRSISYAMEKGLVLTAQNDINGMMSLFDIDKDTLIKISDIYVNGDDMIKKAIDNYVANKNMIKNSIKESINEPKS